MNRKLVLIFSLVVGTTTAAGGFEYSADYKSCIKTANRDGDKINACRNEETSRQDVQLNARYKVLYSSLDRYRKDLLRRSERAWMQFRDAECDFQSSRLIGGPLGIEARAQVAFKAECMLKQTALRAEELKNAYTERRRDPQ